MSFNLSKYEMDVYRKMLVRVGCEVGQLRMKALDGDALPIAWLLALMEQSNVIQFVNYKPDWAHWDKTEVFPVAEVRWPELLDSSIRKQDRTHVVPKEVVLGDEFRPYWETQSVLVRNAGGTNVDSPSPGVPLVVANVRTLTYEPFRKHLPVISPFAGSIFGKSHKSAARKAIRMTRGKDVVNFMPWRGSILFMSDERSLELLLEKLIPDTVLATDADDLLIRHWVRCIRASSSQDVNLHAKSAVELLDKLPMVGA